MSLKVFDLQCGNGHVFEGWFSARNSFDQQASQGLLNCPVCGDDAIERKLSAPRINLGRKRQDDSLVSESAGLVTTDRGAENVAAESPELTEFQGKLLQHMRKLINSSENVGAAFAQEAMKIHNGEAQERAIRGSATADERRELLEEGIDVMPVPDFLNDDQLQ